VTDTGPSNGELSRRMDSLAKDMREGLSEIRADLRDRFDKVPTNEIILAWLAARDAEVQNLRDDVGELKVEIKTVKSEASAAKRFAWQIAIAGGGLLLAVVTFLGDLLPGGTP
jgi:hypothetical protein